MDGQPLRALRQDVAAQEWLDDVAALLKTAGSPTRTRILYLLWATSEVCVNDIAEVLELTTPAISQQLKKLREQGLVQPRREAQTVYYRLNDSHHFATHISTLFERHTRMAA